MNEPVLVLNRVSPTLTSAKVQRLRISEANISEVDEQSPRGPTDIGLCPLSYQRLAELQVWVANRSTSGIGKRRRIYD
jgi:hypothetical protein